MGKLSTHVLDTRQGTPAAGVRIELFSVQDNERLLLRHTETNADGRCDAPLLEGPALEKGTYELVFHAGDYFARCNVPLPDPRFVDVVTLRFGIANPAENYHVPLLVTPWSWSTYRGS
ncbi:MAG: hydroxyisourate hydrolase [Burkholderiaceae bacterium]